jgi:hypothetical protein
MRAPSIPYQIGIRVVNFIAEEIAYSIRRDDIPSPLAFRISTTTCDCILRSRRGCALGEDFSSPYFLSIAIRILLHKPSSTAAS